MDACHLLLGCPWQYDVKAQHDGENNVYVISKNGKQFRMEPFPDQGEEKIVSPIVMMISGKDFSYVLKQEETQGYALVLYPKLKSQQENGAKREVPSEIKAMLDRYEGVVAKDMPDNLPPIRDISHQIDLIRGVTLLNKAAYKMTPKQNEEISRQVQEPLDKGLIRKSLIPCVGTQKRWNMENVH
ncbi:uncharacterized protein LOC131860132 [Cryptomeria japonica]|uniref:uncharacterized protein LOC131860132 n=1 Tax=Cryptomeria japonica TaxID=3369 RepID=UPI0027D9D217|nr:uncharacterized protein LOC131860132 [Cryptomeria japonica]